MDVLHRVQPIRALMRVTLKHTCSYSHSCCIRAMIAAIHLTFDICIVLEKGDGLESLCFPACLPRSTCVYLDESIGYY